MKKMFQQYTLARRNEAKNIVSTVCWLETGLKVGNVVTLKDDPLQEEWTVTEKHNLTREMEDLHQKWNVGGL